LAGDITSSSMIGNPVASHLGLASLVQKELDEQQLLASHLLLRRQQSEALLAAPRLPTSLMAGGPSLQSLVADTLSKNDSPDPAAILRNDQIRQEIDLLRARREFANQRQALQHHDERSNHESKLMSIPSKHSALDSEKMKKPKPLSDAVQIDPSGGEDDAGGDKSPKIANNDSFPHKLYRMLEEAEKDGMDDIACFSPHGKAFLIHKPREFLSDLMPKYFSTNRMSSFQRQLNLYGFRRVKGGADKGGYYHSFFLKGQPELCEKIKRKKPNLNKIAATGTNLDRTTGDLSGMVGNVLGSGIVSNQYDANLLQSYTRNFPGILGGMGYASDTSRIVGLGLNRPMPQNTYGSPLAIGTQPAEQSTTTAALLLAQIQEKEQQRQQIMMKMAQSRLDSKND